MNPNKEDEMNRKKRAVKIDKAMRLVWDSLQSHLHYTHSKTQARGESNAFHKKCVKEYVELMNLLAGMY